MLGSGPYYLDDVATAELVEDAIAGKDDEVVIGLYPERFQIRFRNDCIRVPTELN